MKKLFILIPGLLLSFVSFAQNINYGIIAGLDFGTIEASAQGTAAVHYTDAHLSSEIGAFVDFKLSSISLQPALLFTGKGGNLTTGDGGTGQFALHYVQIPFNVNYNFALPFGSIYFGVGPYLAFGSGGTLSLAGPAGNDTETANFGGSGDFSSTETGIDIIGGFKLKSGLLLRLNYDIGLSNILNQNGPEAYLGSFKTHTFGITAGFAF